MMKRLSLAVIFLTVIISFGYTVQNRWKGEYAYWQGTIGSDGYGYYAYLPCIFIYHHLDFNRAVQEAQKINPGATGFVSPIFQNKVVDKYFPGTAILLTPFFLIAYWLSHLLGYSTGGYEFPFQASVAIGALFYLAIGLIFIRKLFKEFQISEFVISITLPLLVFGSNLLYYATMEPSMSHIYSFSITAIFLYFSKKSIDNFRLKNLIFMTVAMSILLLIRPTNLLSLIFIPFLAGDIKKTKEFVLIFFKSKKIFILFAIAASILSMQLVLWYAETGHLFLYSYQGESFDFKKPHFFDILFSYEKGWFVYTPLMFIALLGGLIILFRQNRFRFSIALFSFFIITYVLSSWWMWTYSGDFGLRAFVDFYAFYAILLAILLNSLPSIWLKSSVIFLTLLCVGLNLIQTFQYCKWILPYDGMNKEKYWKIFLQTDRSYMGILDRPDTANFNVLPNCNFINSFDPNAWGNNNDNITAAYAHSGTYSSFINDRHQSTPVLALKASSIPKANRTFVFVRLWAYMPNMDNDASIAISITPEKGDCYYWVGKKIQGFVFDCNKWTQAYTIMELPAFKNPTDNISVCVYTPAGIAYIDDMDVVFETPK
jgi:hypothetical protein